MVRHLSRMLRVVSSFIECANLKLVALHDLTFRISTHFGLAAHASFVKIVIAFCPFPYSARTATQPVCVAIHAQGDNGREVFNSQHQADTVPAHTDFLATGAKVRTAVKYLEFSPSIAFWKSELLSRGTSCSVLQQSSHCSWVIPFACSSAVSMFFGSSDWNCSSTGT